MKRLITTFSFISLTILALFMTNQVLLLAKPPVAAVETMHSANQLYEAGQFTQAAQGYEQLIGQGYADAALFYNLGNTYFKLGDYGRAILNYRRAEQLAPRDKDIAANLALARAQVAAQPTTPDKAQNPGENAAGTTPTWFTLNELALAALGFWVLFMVLVIAWNNSLQGTIWRTGLQAALTVTTAALVISGFGLGSRLVAGQTQIEGVIVTPEINVTSGPGAQYVTAFTLHNGAEIKVLEARENWVRLALPNADIQGWVPASSVEVVAPEVG